MGQDEILSNLILELRRGTVVLSVLSILKTPMYGYNLVSTMADYGITAEANTLYPLLRRLETQGLLTSTWETGGAKPRKYYVITEYGTKTLAKLKSHWQGTVESLNKIWGKEND